MADQKDLGTQGTEDSVKGKLTEATGKAQEGLGKLTGNKHQQGEGEGRQLKGKMQQGIGKVERKADDALDS